MSMLQKALLFVSLNVALSLAFLRVPTKLNTCIGWNNRISSPPSPSPDLLKYDNCGDQNTIGQPESRYPVMRDALNATGRQMIFAACEWAVDFPGTWMAPVRTPGVQRTTFRTCGSVSCRTSTG